MGRFVNFCAGVNMHVSPAKHIDAILVNVPHNGLDERSIKETKRMFVWAKARWKQLDSGGFQFAEAERKGRELMFDSTKPPECSKERVNLTPEHVFKAAAEIKPIIVNALDFPIGKFTDPNEREMEFMKKLGFNARWAKECSALRDILCPKVKLFIPMQCFNLKQFNVFLDLIGDISYEGFSIPTRNFGIKEIALFLIKFYQMGIREVHVLGSTSFFMIALSVYMARNYFDWISVDATTWRELAQYSVYMNKHNFSSEHLGNAIVDENIVNDCECPWCRDVTFTQIKNLPQTDRIALLRCHNFWVIDQACKDLYRHSSTVIDLERYLRRKSPKTEKIDELVNTLALVDSLKDENINVLEQLLLGPNMN